MHILPGDVRFVQVHNPQAGGHNRLDIRVLRRPLPRGVRGRHRPGEDLRRRRVRGRAGGGHARDANQPHIGELRHDARHVLGAAG